MDTHMAGLRCFFKKSLRPCALDESSHSIVWAKKVFDCFVLHLLLTKSQRIRKYKINEKNDEVKEQKVTHKMTQRKQRKLTCETETRMMTHNSVHQKRICS